MSQCYQVLEPRFLCHQAYPDTSQPFTRDCIRLCWCYLLYCMLSPSVSEHNITSFCPQTGASSLMTQSQTVEKGKTACQGLQQQLGSCCKQPRGKVRPNPPLPLMNVSSPALPRLSQATWTAAERARGEKSQEEATQIMSVCSTRKIIWILELWPDFAKGWSCFSKQLKLFPEKGLMAVSINGQVTEYSFVIYFYKVPWDSFGC